MRCLPALLLSFLSATAFAYKNPVMTPNLVRLRSGETTTLALTTIWSGISGYPQTNIFGSDAPLVAEITGSLKWNGNFSDPAVLTPIQVNALAPGVAHVIDLATGNSYATVIVECALPGTAFAFAVEPVVSTTVQTPVTLEVSANGFLNPSFHWFSGQVGNVTIPLRSHSNQLTLPFYYGPATFPVWAEVADECNYSTVAFTVNVVTSKRRRAMPH